MKRCIVNLSTAKFRKGQHRLLSSLNGNTNADICFYTRESEVGAPLHKDSPYAFKPYAIVQAAKQGYETLLWLDASMIAIRNLEPIFEHIERKGYFWQDSGWDNPRWTTPAQKEWAGTDEGRMISAGVVGFNIRGYVGRFMLKTWLRSAEDGMFKGTHEETRHDQTMLSLIIERMDAEIVDNNTFWSYGAPTEAHPENILILANGII